MNEGYEYLHEELDALRRNWRGYRTMSGFLLAAAAVLLVLALAALADNLARFGVGGRMFAALAVWTTAAAAVVLYVRHCVRVRRGDDYFAVLVENRHPGLKNLLVNAIQLGRGEESEKSPGLVDAIVRDAGRVSSDIEWTAMLDKQAVRRSGVVMGAVLVIGLVYGALYTPFMANGVARVLLPLSSISPYTATRVPVDGVHPGNARVPEGSDLTFEARIEGAVPNRVQLVRLNPDGELHPLRMVETRGAPGMFTFSLPDIETSFEYFVQAGGGRSDTYKVEVVQRPRVTNLEVEIAPPAYTGLDASESADSDGAVAALAGSEIRFRVTSGKSLAKATLVAAGNRQSVRPLERAEDDKIWKTAFALWSEAVADGYRIDGVQLHGPARYRFELLDVEGYENFEPVWRTLSVVKDQSPVVTFPSPRRDLQIQPDGRVPLTIQATDDFGLAGVAVYFRINDETEAREMVRFEGGGTPGKKRIRESYEWNPGEVGLSAGDLAQYWAEALDCNEVTGPGRGESRRYTVYLLTPEQAAMHRDLQLADFAQAMEELLRMQRRNRAETASSFPVDTLVERQVRIRLMTVRLAAAMEKGPLPLQTMVDSLNNLHAGPMADVIQHFERAEDLGREQSLPVQDAIIAELEQLLRRLQRNDQARKRLKKLAKTDEPAFYQTTNTLGQILENLGRLIVENEAVGKQFEKLPKRPVDETDEETEAALKSMERLQEKWGEWTQGTIDDLTKLPTGFVDDFDLRPDVKRIFEEIERVTQRSKATKMDIPLEEAGASLSTKMLEDLDIWMMDSPDSLQWNMEEPLGKLDIPEMPLPGELVDLMGELLQEADEFDQEAEDMTSAWGDNLNQAGWGVMDGPISTFSAKGVTGNDLPNQTELSGRSADGRRGKSTGQAVGDTSRGLDGRKTPARLTGERYEPGVLKQLGQDDPQGVTGGGKKTGAGETGLQGGTPPDFVRDMNRLKEWQARIREKTERVAKRLELTGRNSAQLASGILIMKAAEQDYEDLRYANAARRRRIGLNMMKTALTDQIDPTGIQHRRARRLPVELREEMVQASEDVYPEGYEDILKAYYRRLSESAKH